jgi:hypothetical protein
MHKVSANDLLPTGAIDCAVALQHNCPSSACTGSTGLVDLETKLIRGNEDQWRNRKHTNPLVAEVDLQTLILYSAPLAGRDVS